MIERQELTLGRAVGAARWFAFVTLTLSGALISGALAQGEKAKQLIDMVSARYRSVKTERERLEVLIVALPQEPRFTLREVETMVREGGRGITHKRAVRHARYAQDRHDKIHVSFSLPPKDAGTGFLVWRQPGTREDNQWLYMPALKRVRRVPVSSTATFVGTNLTYEDVRELAGENVERYTYEDVGVETVDGRDCEVVVARPAAGTSSAYSSRKMWIDKDRLLTLKIEYYGQGNKTRKVLYNSAIEEVKPGIYRPRLTEVRDLLIDEATVVWVSDREVGLDIPEEVFTRDYLENP